MEQAPDEANPCRADRLHRHIDELKAEPPPGSDKKQPVTDESPRDFIHRRMRELDEGEQGERPAPSERQPPGLEH
ncbi:hypothetical protein ONA91_31565 [Micromonospora sp. DR5-3]|uniref:hypothetical protein n=1 Tax=unclassified Micromonospora TaxID=2617518 RepID=UPI0016528343|nr:MULTISPECIES: hypothetical protein [unclassified Micromonospora]MCW3818985.1 hypothetical protein [Micromonospora sp. DR5-3]